VTEEPPKYSDDVALLFAVMPRHIREALEAARDPDRLLEVVLDLGRIPEARYPDRMVGLSDGAVSREEIDQVVNRLGTFTADNRAGIERTLHRISAIRNRLGTIIGLTCRVGRAVYGTVDILRDVIEAGKSLLLLGRPGVGKTTLLRESARVLADDLGKRVVIVDTSNEIGGDGDIPHPGIGRARRMQVPSPDRQHGVMIEAVENHMPEVIVIDEIGTTAEALASRTIAERGVQLVATAHGNSLENLLQNPTLSDLVGGIQAVTLSDEEARRRGTQKTVLERKAPPTFTVLVEIQDRDRLAIHHNVSAIVDAHLRGTVLAPELRIRLEGGGVEIRKENPSDEEKELREGMDPALPPLPSMAKRRRPVRVFTYGISRSRLERAVEKFQAPMRVVEEIERADVVLTLKSQVKRQPRRIRVLQAQGIPFHVIRGNTVTQMEHFLRELFGEELDGRAVALREAEEAVNEVYEGGTPVELSPRPGHLRFLQHQVAERYGLISESKGSEPYRRVIIVPL
jgi:stage III sporulation protein SpoIIIAA